MKKVIIVKSQRAYAHTSIKTLYAYDLLECGVLRTSIGDYIGKFRDTTSSQEMEQIIKDYWDLDNVVGYVYEADMSGRLVSAFERLGVRRFNGEKVYRIVERE